MTVSLLQSRPAGRGVVAVRRVVPDVLHRRCPQPMRIERDSPPRWPRLGLLGASLCLVVAGCSQSTEGSVESGSAPAVGAPAEEGLPLLPPADERQPELFDERGCLITGSDDADCTTTADEVDAGAAGGSTTDERSLEGFLGTSWVESPVGTGPVVLGETVVAGPGADGRWKARSGLKPPSKRPKVG